MKPYSLLLVCFLSFNLNAQQNASIEEITRHIEKQLIVFPQEKIYLQNDKPIYTEGEKIWFKVYIADATTHRPVAVSRYAYVELINENGSIVNRVKVRKDSLNLYNGHIQLPDHLIEGNYRLRAYTRYASLETPDYLFSRNIQIHSANKTYPDAYNNSTDYEVSFFPEGGYLPVDIQARIAFKAAGANGLHQNITGILIDNAGQTIDSIYSFHDGMGVFEIMAKENQKYYLRCHNEQGVEKTFDLPSPKPDAYSLRADSRADKLYVTVSSPGILLQNQ